MSTSSPEPARATSPDRAHHKQADVAGQHPASGQASERQAPHPAQDAAEPPQDGPHAAEPPHGGPNAAEPSHGGRVARAGDVADPSRVRRAPRYGRFGVAGFLVGALVALLLAVVPAVDHQFARGDVFLVLLLGCGTAGVLSGLAWALAADRRALRRRTRRPRRSGKG